MFRYRYLSAVSWPKEEGSGQDSLLHDRSSSRSDVNTEMLLGIEFDNKFRCSIKAVSFCSPPNADGMLPENELNDKFSSPNNEHKASAVGMVREREFLLRSSLTRAVRDPTIVGMR